MFRHVVLLTFSDEASDAQVQEVVDGLRSLPAAIPEIRGYEVGRDAGLATGNADVVVVADFDDAEAYAVYRDHPVHQEVIATRIAPLLAARSAVQQER
jgi:hypothetical protein